MEHLDCKCGSEYDVEGTTGRSRDPVMRAATFCGIAQNPGRLTNVHYTLIMTKHGRCFGEDVTWPKTNFRRSQSGGAYPA